MKSFAIIGAILFIACAAHSADPTYAFLGGSYNTGVVEAFEISSDGSITLRSSFDIRKTYPMFADTLDIAISPQGDSACFLSFSGDSTYLYSIDDNMVFTPSMKISSNGCLGGGYSWDGQYLFATSGTDLNPPKPKILIMKKKGIAFETVAEQEVPTTATLRYPMLCSSRDEIISTAFVGFINAPPAIVVYQLDRSKQLLDRKQYLPTERIVGMGASRSRDVIVHATGHVVCSYRRNENGLYEKKSQFTIMPGWEEAWGWGACVTPDEQYAVAIMFDDLARPDVRNAGLYLFKVNPKGELEYQSLYFQKSSEAISITPDGKFIVVSSEYGKVLTVFRINRTKNQLEVVSTIPHPQSRIYSMAFFPNKRPKMPVAEKSWSLYGDSARPSQKIAQKIGR